MNSLQIRKLTYAALFLALAMVLPFLTGQIPQIGKSLCPMHTRPCCAASCADGPGDWLSD